MKYIKAIGLLLLLALGGGFWHFQPTLKLGAGYAAKMACSCHYLQGRSLEDIQENDLNFSALPLVSLTQNTEKKTITASFFGLVNHTATFVERRGCIVPVDEQLALPAPPKPPGILTASKPLPRYDTLPAGLDTKKLEIALDSAFEPLPEGGTRGIVVLYDGHLIAERYAPGFDENTLLHGWSMTKSITNALIGLMVKNNQLSLDQDHLFPEWEDDDRAQITLANLLHMNSGLAWNEAYGSISDATQMLYGAADMAAYTIAHPIASEPKKEWVYSSGTTNVLSKLIRNTLNNDKAYLALLRDSLFTPLGIHSALIEPDQSGTLVGSSYGWATARDWARFGLLYLNEGKVDNYQLLPEGWVDFSRQPAQGSDGIYGAQIWLQTEDATHAPKDVFMFRGFQDQRIVIIPSRRCVIVRLGKNKDQSFPLNRFIKEVLDALNLKET